MQNEMWKRVRTAAFIEGDVYIDYPYEAVKFRFERATLKVFQRFYGEPEDEIPHNSELYNEAHSGGWRITAEDYFLDKDKERHEEDGGLEKALADRLTPSCDVCGQKPAEFHDSALGRKPYRRCEMCFENGAESITAICLKIFLEDGLEKVEKNDPGEWWPYGVKSYDEGCYIGWPEIRVLYPEHSRFFRKNF